MFKQTSIYQLSIVIIIGFTFCTLSFQVAEADIFQYIDDQGVLHLTDKPDNKDATLLRNSAKKKTHKKSYHTPKELKGRFNRYIDNISRDHNVDPYLIRAIVEVESSYNHLAVSPKGALGLMQIMPATAKRFGVKNPFDPYSNIEGGVRYLKYLLKLFDNELRLSIAAYNCGERRVIEQWQIPQIKETQNYVKKVMTRYSRYRSLNNVPQRIVRFADENGIIHLSNRPNEKK